MASSSMNAPSVINDTSNSNTITIGTQIANLHSINIPYIGNYIVFVSVLYADGSKKINGGIRIKSSSDYNIFGQAYDNYVRIGTDIGGYKSMSFGCFVQTKINNASLIVEGYNNPSILATIYISCMKV